MAVTLVQLKILSRNANMNGLKLREGYEGYFKSLTRGAVRRGAAGEVDVMGKFGLLLAVLAKDPRDPTRWPWLLTACRILESPYIAPIAAGEGVFSSSRGTGCWQYPPKAPACDTNLVLAFEVATRSQ